MKRIVILSYLIVLCLFLAACRNTGKTNGAEIVFSSSIKFDEMEITSAIDAVIIKFADYTGWNWILIRDSKTDEWKLVDWGY